MREYIQGKWNWEYVAGYFGSYSGNNDQFSGMAIEFKDDSTLVVTVDNEKTLIANWYVVEMADNKFRIEVSPYIDQLDGLILTSTEKKQLVFSNSLTDGNDHYFSKMK